MRVHKGNSRGKARHNVSSIRWQMAAGNQKYDGAKEISICWMDSNSGNIRGSLRSRCRDTFASQTHHRERCPHHLHQQSVGISNLNQQFESAVDISSESTTSHKWWNDCMDLNNTKVVKSYTGEGLSSTIIYIIFISNQLTSASALAANCDCSQCTYRQQASHPDR